MRDCKYDEDGTEPDRPVFDTYGRFRLCNCGCGRPRTWIEFSGEQASLLERLCPGEGVFAVTVRPARGGAVLP